jgi:hypothetical protein
MRPQPAESMPTPHFELPPPKPLRILVAGEVVLDRYLWGEVERISPEAPIPVLRVTRHEERPGNAAFVCANLAAFGAPGRRPERDWHRSSRFFARRDTDSAWSRGRRLGSRFQMPNHREGSPARLGAIC